MPTIKTAISIDSLLFDEVEKLAQKNHVSRSQIFAQAVESLIKKKDNIILLQKLNEAYDSGFTPEEAVYNSHSKHSTARLVKTTWK